MSAASPLSPATLPQSALDPASLYQTRIQQLREQLQQYGCEAVIVPTADPHLSEYLPEYWQARVWLSGFDGSAGTLLVTLDDAGLWTDSRYWTQAAAQLQGTGIELYKLEKGAETHIDWLVRRLPERSQIAIDGRALSLSEQQRLHKAFADTQLQLMTQNDLLADLWIDRPELPCQPVYPQVAEFVDLSAAEKLQAVRTQMLQCHASHHLLSSLDDIAWLTNLRGADVEYNPVFLAHALLSADEATLFVDIAKLSGKLAQTLNETGWQLAAYDAVGSYLSALDKADTLLIDPNKVAVATLAQLPPAVTMIEQSNPSTLMKACKSEAELEHIREAMRQDGQALCAFFAEFEARLEAGERLTELDVDTLLIEARHRQPQYVSPSFATIAGFNANGASPHYRATPASHATLTGDGLLLIDSGGQYHNGTTDITRMVGIGQVSAEQKRDMTLVLKAHIGLAVAYYPEGISAPLLDALARVPLWREGLDYGHGTGHGVGYFLNVHEGPQSIAYAAPATAERGLQQGMVTSIEPALYREGQWGIRIENLVATVPAQTSEYGNFLRFETLTLCPIDTRLLEVGLLSDTERQWLNDYHTTVYQRLHLGLTEQALTWLVERTKAI